MSDDAENVTRLNTIVAEDIMTEEVTMIKEDMLIGQVAHRMLRERVSGYPVTDEENVIVGVVTLTDLFLLLDKINHVEKGAVSSAISEYKNQPISSIMTKQVLRISPQTTVAEIIDIVTKWNIHTFPVIEDDNIVGIVSRHDVLNAAFVYG